MRGAGCSAGFSRAREPGDAREETARPPLAVLGGAARLRPRARGHCPPACLHNSCHKTELGTKSAWPGQVKTRPLPAAGGISTGISWLSSSTRVQVYSRGTRGGGGEVKRTVAQGQGAWPRPLASRQVLRQLPSLRQPALLQAVPATSPTVGPGPIPPTLATGTLQATPTFDTTAHTCACASHRVGQPALPSPSLPSCLGQPSTSQPDGPLSKMHQPGLAGQSQSPPRGTARDAAGHCARVCFSLTSRCRRPPARPGALLSHSPQGEPRQCPAHPLQAAPALWGLSVGPSPPHSLLLQGQAPRARAAREPMRNVSKAGTEGRDPCPLERCPTTSSRPATPLCQGSFWKSEALDEDSRTNGRRCRDHVGQARARSQGVGLPSRDVGAEAGRGRSGICMLQGPPCIRGHWPRAAEAPGCGSAGRAAWTLGPRGGAGARGWRKQSRQAWQRAPHQCRGAGGTAGGTGSPAGRSLTGHRAPYLPPAPLCHALASPAFCGARHVTDLPRGSHCRPRHKRAPGS
ncbi:collagen alpha-1(III) chain-like [Sciurus carolinensis]|uniref:collagen alpha-1(III) chain-like n=1 Tax=Sciurus carolinensis TaxID=30640 RepID=UPI001FB32F68|nr:collagen alpha-1(III) chain-like [Sciurus carolinensis]XP_047376293.1 collagen alpha-1(III) chain-like [Sciurus carolinensis]